MFIILVVILLLFIYFYTTQNFDYWSKRNIKYDTPLPLFGNHLKCGLGMKSLIAVSCELYNKYPNEKVVGYFRGRTPELIIRDPDIARAILNVDFASFYPRGFGRDPTKEPLLKNLFHADGDSWKLLRQRLTPAFTTSKLKNMFPLIVKCAEKLEHMGKEIIAGGGECDVRDFMARFTTEFIGACGFGIEMDTINNENSVFRNLGKQMFHRSIKNVSKDLLWAIFPEVGKMLGVYIFDKKLETIISSIVLKIFEQRNYKPSGRNDFIDILLELSAKGKVKGESLEYRNSDGSPKEVELEIDLECLIAQVFVFFAAGFETSSSATSFALHELAYNIDLQRKIQAEIDAVLLKYDNKLCYDAVNEMTLLEMAFKESLRILPPLGVLNRVCAAKYTIPQLGISLDPGVKIIIPIQAIQNDERYFENPQVFNPERFANEKIDEVHKYIFLPFGEGPRACIGARLGQMQSIAGLAAVLHKFTVEPSEKSTRTIKMNPRLNVVQGVLNGIPLRLKLREK
ncbi:cytochrome P450 6B6-like [Melitaea cinxia]|uniref:cytochrome P450 6B6-like n=1 Tax=Melitaea cinxia TaxID=113334 RepID=UPI001E272B05|nr:cytochrome P450 6B6-like [Melitaea cinxia]